jgi:carbonic anhydrase
VVVLGHTSCGAIDAVLRGQSGEYIRFIADSIQEAIGAETDPYKACWKNIEHCCAQIEGSLSIQQDEKKYGLRVVGAIYNIETGEVSFK